MGCREGGSILKQARRRSNRKCLLCGMLLMILGSSALQAQMLPTVRTEFRTDALWQTNEDPQDVNKGRTTLRFIVKRAHLNLEGKMDDDLSYRLRVRWNKSFAAQDDNTGVGLEYWYLKHQWQPGLEFRLGKHRILQGGREGVHNPLNVFEYSTVGERIQHFSEVGVSAFYDLGTLTTKLQDQYMVGQIFNQLSGSSKNQFALSYNFAWYGSFAGGLIEPIFQYGIFPHAEENKKDATTGKKVVTQESYSESFLSMGTLLNLDPWRVELDMLNHIQNSYKKRTGTTTVKHHSEDNTSIIIAGHFGNPNVAMADNDRPLVPFAKWVYDNLKERRASATVKTVKNEFQLGSAFFPKINHYNFRLHAMFVYEWIGGDVSDYSQYRLNGGASAQF